MVLREPEEQSRASRGGLRIRVSPGPGANTKDKRERDHRALGESTTSTFVCMFDMCRHACGHAASSSAARVRAARGPDHRGHDASVTAARDKREYAQIDCALRATVLKGAAGPLSSVWRESR